MEVFTYVMSKSQHKEMLNTLKDSIADELNKIPNSTDYPNVTKVEPMTIIPNLLLPQLVQSFRLRSNFLVSSFTYMEECTMHLIIYPLLYLLIM